MDAQSERLPTLTPALVIEITSLEVFRNQFGMNACRDRGVGARRKLLGPIADDPRSFFPDHVEMARDGARNLLAGVCKACRHKSCKFKTWGMD